MVHQWSKLSTVCTIAPGQPIPTFALHVIFSDAGSHACCSAYTGLCWGYVCFLCSFKSAACLSSAPTAENEVVGRQCTRMLQSARACRDVQKYLAQQVILRTCLIASHHKRFSSQM